MSRQPFPQPRDWIRSRCEGEKANPQHRFGRNADPEWLEAGPGLASALLGATKAQHQLGLRIHWFADRAGKTEADVAKFLGVDERTVGRLLNGTIHMTVSQLYAIARALDLSAQANLRQPRPAETKGTSDTGDAPPELPEQCRDGL